MRNQTMLHKSKEQDNFVIRQQNHEKKRKIDLSKNYLFRFKEK